MEKLKKMTFAVLGFGGRGATYTACAQALGSDVVAVCDPSEYSRNRAINEFGVHADKVFSDEDEFFACGKLADVLIIGTMDKDHYRGSMKALDIGYDILLEKPISPDVNECLEIAKKSKEVGREVFVCHVMRYTPYMRYAKNLLDSGKFGKILHIEANEHVAYYHFAHSFCRGNWRNVETSAPILLAKSCHDMDAICWLMDGKKCEVVSSMGDLVWFKEENAPEGSSKYCFECKYKDSCQYSAFRLYHNEEYENIAALAKHGRLGKTPEEIDKSLSDKNNVLARCVYRCDNDVCDRQVVQMRFEDGTLASFNLTAFTEDMHRDYRIYCSKGSIRICCGIVTSQIFGEEEIKRNVLKEETADDVSLYKHHGGGDIRCVESIIRYFTEGVKTSQLTSIDVSVMSHQICHHAEISRQKGGTQEKIIYKD